MSLKHAHWHRQARRLQAYLRFFSSRSDQASPDHAANVWSAIKGSKGFEPNFVQWWASSHFHVHGAPQTCPEVPPGKVITQVMYDSFLLAFRDLETTLHKACRASAKAKRLNSPQLIFQDIRQIGPDSVDPLQSKICHFDDDTLCMHPDQEQDWDLKQPVFVHAA
jgi:hypothetical protein